MLRSVLIVGLGACGFSARAEPSPPTDTAVPTEEPPPTTPPTEPTEPAATTCTVHHLLFGRYQGVCLASWDKLQLVPRGTCAEGLHCVPCEQFGIPTGAPGC